MLKAGPAASKPIETIIISPLFEKQKINCMDTNLVGLSTTIINLTVVTQTVIRVKELEQVKYYMVLPIIVENSSVSFEFMYV